MLDLKKVPIVHLFIIFEIVNKMVLGVRVCCWLKFNSVTIKFSLFFSFLYFDELVVFSRNVMFFHKLHIHAFCMIACRLMWRWLVITCYT